MNFFCLQPGPNAKVQVYAGPGNLVTVTVDLDSRIENLVEFIGTVTSPTTMRADTYYVLNGEQAEDFGELAFVTFGLLILE